MPVRNIMNSSTSLVEIFSSIQGEGYLAGYRQIFIRFPGCNLDCSYCDTILNPPATCRVETEPGNACFRETEQPVALSTVLDIIHKWCKKLPAAHHSVSITGGEPMVHAGILESWLPEINILLPVHLETNGTMPEKLPRLIEHLDYISMDIKIPSSASTPGFWDEHRRFMEIGLERDLSVKMIVGEDTLDKDLLKAARLVAELDEDIPCFLQPVTGRDGRISIPAARLMRYQEMLAPIIEDLRIIPQMHRFMEVP